MDQQPLERLVVTEAPYNAEAPLAALVEGRTPTELVYVRNHFEVPRLDAARWSLDVGGLVEGPAALSYEEVQGLPTKTLKITLECAGNGRSSMDPVPKGTPWRYGAVSIVEFTGTPVSKVLERVGIQRGAAEAVFYGADRGEVEPGRVEPFARSLPMDVALGPDTLLAWAMNGKPLKPEHGYPLRLVVPGWYGMASVKWLQRISLVDGPFEGFFQNEHYVYLDEHGTEDGDPVGRIRPRSLVTSPSGVRVLEAGRTVEIAGIAWSGGGPIVKVEVSVDGGDHWQTTELDPQTSTYGVQRWRMAWAPEDHGRIELISRATDSLGNSQPLSQRWNRLGYGNNGPQVVAVTVG